MTNRQYTAGDIQVLEGLDAVRMRPGMYIGTTGIKGLHHILWEIVDNAVDEAANGFADRLSIVLNTDNSATVSDNGRGIPVDIHPQLKISGVRWFTRSCTRAASSTTKITAIREGCTAWARPSPTRFQSGST